MSRVISITAPCAATLVRLEIQAGARVAPGALIGVLETGDGELPVRSAVAGVIDRVHAASGEALAEHSPICSIRIGGESRAEPGRRAATPQLADKQQLHAEVQARLARTLDPQRSEAARRRHARGFRTARENLADLCDPGSFQEYGQLAVAAQRNRRDFETLSIQTAADGVITGTATINADLFPAEQARAAVIVNDYTVLAGTQGYFHHRKLDRALHLAADLRLPVVMYTEGGGGRPGDTDQEVGMEVTTFAAWAGLAGRVPRIAVNNGYCFAGNAALFGCADITVATRESWIGMAGPAMIEGGGLGSVAPTAIGPTDVQTRTGVIDVLAEDERHATRLARQLLGYFQGAVGDWRCADQRQLWELMPADRRFSYDVRRIIHALADIDSFIEIRPDYGRTLITGLLRIEGRPMGVLANDCRVLGGAIDTQGSASAARFLQICDAFDIPVVSLIDTPGFMVGPDSETEGAVRVMSDLFIAGARLRPPLVAIFLRKGYGLGAIAMTGGSFSRPVYAAAWPTGEFGAMGLEGAVQLGFKRELDAAPTAAAREALFARLLEAMYERGKAAEAASHLEIDAVIEPQDTRKVILRALLAHQTKR
ncbi:MAG: biotin carboxylase [Porticoccaceae bacterium]|nr:biotin carboxylase [Porticoccaceae bacterium]